MTNEYISKQYAVNAINDALKRVFTEHVGEGIINPLKPADVEPVVYGRWVYVDDDDMRYDTYYCSECRNRITVDSYRRDDIGFTIDDMERCNKCGARMDTQEEE